jgi:CPA1 family monovalent cation:H+ antiporter
VSPVEWAEVIVLLLAVAVVLAWIARRIHVPDAILLVAGGIGIAFLPLGFDIKLDPDLVLLLFVAPLLYAEAYYAPMRELKNNVGSIAILSTILVVVTMGVVAVVAHWAIGVPWEVAFVLGAALGATDALAPVQVMGGSGADHQLEAVVQGESLFNDGIAFALVGVTTAAAASGAFEAGSAAGKLALYVPVGIGVGLAVAWLTSQARKRTDVVMIEAGVSLLTPFAAYVLAEILHGSGILAAVAAGLWLGTRAHDLVEPLTRVELQATWQIITFVLNSLLFLLVGLAGGDLVGKVEHPAIDVILAGLAITVAVIGVRFLWAMTIGPAWRGAARMFAERVRPAQTRPWRIGLAWSGVRGSVALAAILSLPATLDAGGPMPARDLVIVLALFTIVLTLLVQGLTLRPLLFRLGLTDPDAPRREELQARRAAADAALEQLEDAAERNALGDEEYGWLKREYMLRRGQAEDDERAEVAEERLEAAEQTDLEMLEAARAAVLKLEEEGEVRADVAQKVIRKLDLDSARLRS